MATVDNTDYSSCTVQPDENLKNLFVLARVSNEDRLMIVKADYTTVADFALIGRTGEQFDERIKQMFPKFAVAIDEKEDEARKKIKGFVTLSALWERARLRQGYRRSEQGTGDQGLR